MSETKTHHALYLDPACSYCQDVLGALEGLPLEVELRDVRASEEHRADLVEARGRARVPVLKISEPGTQATWMPESRAIIRYLRERAGQPAGGVDVARIQLVLHAGMWALLVAGLFFAEWQSALWIGALALGAVRSFWNAKRTRVWYHAAIGLVFLVGMGSIAARGLGVADLPWWYVAYGFAGLLLLTAILLRFRAATRR